MQFTDTWGTPLAEGDAVYISLGSDLVRGQIIKLDAGLGIQQNPNGTVSGVPPSAQIAVVVGSHALPDGRLIGVGAAKDGQKQAVIA